MRGNGKKSASKKIQRRGRKMMNSDETIGMKMVICDLIFIPSSHHRAHCVLMNVSAHTETYEHVCCCVIYSSTLIFTAHSGINAFGFRKVNLDWTRKWLVFLVLDWAPSQTSYVTVISV